MEDLIESVIDDLEDIEAETYSHEPSSAIREMSVPVNECPEAGDVTKNSVTIIQHRKAKINGSISTRKSTIEGSEGGLLAQRRSAELVTAVESYTEPPGHQKTPSAPTFRMSDAANISKLMDMFEHGLPSGEDVADDLLLREPSTFLRKLKLITRAGTSSTKMSPAQVSQFHTLFDVQSAKSQ